jgi:nicotinamidase-related amidase
MNSKELVLLVVDMQNGFLGPHSHHILPPVVRLVQEYKKRGLPVVFSRFHNGPNSQYERLMGWTRLRSSPEIDISSDLQPYAQLVLDKNMYSAFTPAFNAMIEQQEWRVIAICGVATDGCILKTAVDAFEKGLIPIVVTDACASHAGDDIHRAGLLLLERFVGKKQLINTDTLLATIDHQKSLHTMLDGNGQQTKSTACECASS